MSSATRAIVTVCQGKLQNRKKRYIGTTFPGFGEVLRLAGESGCEMQFNLGHCPSGSAAALAFSLVREDRSIDEWRN